MASNAVINVVDDAHEYSDALDQLGEGGALVFEATLRLIAKGIKDGVPRSIGMSDSAWAERRLGGYRKFSIVQRRELVSQLIDDGLSQRQAAAVLGVGQPTVSRDLARDSYESEDYQEGADQAQLLGQDDSFESSNEPAEFLS